MKYPVCLVPYGGQVDIGTTTPSVALEVAGRISTSNTVGFTYTTAQSFTDANLGYVLDTKTALYTVGVTPIPAGLKSVYSFSVPARGTWLIIYNLAITGVASSGTSEVFISNTLDAYDTLGVGGTLTNTVTGSFFGASSTIALTTTGATTLYLNIFNGGGGVLNGNSTIVRIRIA